MKQQMTLFVQALDITKTNNKRTKSGICCLLWLYPEPERRVGFIVCFGYIKSLNKEWV
jgi:hypothetical protein